MTFSPAISGITPPQNRDLYDGVYAWADSRFPTGSTIVRQSNASWLRTRRSSPLSRDKTSTCFFSRRRRRWRRVETSKKKSFSFQLWETIAAVSRSIPSSNRRDARESSAVSQASVGQQSNSNSVWYCPRVESRSNLFVKICLSISRPFLDVSRAITKRKEELSRSWCVLSLIFSAARLASRRLGSEKSTTEHAMTKNCRQFERLQLGENLFGLILKCSRLLLWSSYVYFCTTYITCRTRTFTILLYTILLYIIYYILLLLLYLYILFCYILFIIYFYFYYTFIYFYSNICKIVEKFPPQLDPSRFRRSRFFFSQWSIKTIH